MSACGVSRRHRRQSPTRLRVGPSSVPRRRVSTAGWLDLRKFHRRGAKSLHHPLVGDLTLAYEAFELAADPGQRINVYTTEPGSPSDEALSLLASWAATPTEIASAKTTEER